MSPAWPDFVQVAPAVRKALHAGAPVVALESTVITHGLPKPDNLSLALDMEAAVRYNGATPATIGVLEGKVVVGLSGAQIRTLAYAENPRKLSARDLAAAVAQKALGGTTVAGTLQVCGIVGIRTFATGGIGGVHRWPPEDISADLPQLARTPAVVVCAGAKAILNLPATVEYLETMGVPVIGYKTEEFPAFYSAESGLKVGVRAQNAAEVAAIARAHWALGASTAVLVVVPPPNPLPRQEVEQAIEQAVAEAKAQGIRGQAVTPFLLARVAELTGQASLEANLALLKHNAAVAAEIASHLAERRGLHRA